MAIEYLGLSEINGPLIALEGVKDAAYDEIVEFSMNDGAEKRLGRIIEIYKDKAVIQVFEGSEGMSLSNTHTKLTGHPMEIALSPDILGRTFNGIGQPIDGLGPIVAEEKRDVNGKPLNPVSREYPRNYIRTGISAIDGLTTLIRGQKLPIFSGNGLPHDQLAAQIVNQSSLGDDVDEEFAVVFAAMGVKHDVAEFFQKTFEESGASEHVVMFLNLANDPVVERLITPKVALTVAEYLAYEKNMHILVVLTDMTSFAEAMREVSSSKGEIPSRKGYPGYLYSELATIYERAGIVEGAKGSSPCFLTMFFRNCSLMLMFLLEEQTQKEVTRIFDHLTELLGIELFQKLFEVILTDNGHEFQDRQSLEYSKNDEVRTRIYYCDPNRSDQKGALEKNHEYIRYVLPKGTSFEKMTDKTTLLLLNHINSEKRDSLNGHSPYEVSRLLLDNRLHKALGLAEIPADEVTLIPALIK